jgi:hypothetical protein
VAAGVNAGLLAGSSRGESVGRYLDLNIKKAGYQYAKVGTTPSDTPIALHCPSLVLVKDRLTVGMPYCAAKTRSRPGVTAFGAGVINAIVLIAMVAGVGASGLLSGWITVPALVVGVPCQEGKGERSGAGLSWTALLCPFSCVVPLAGAS